ncbi:MAG: invasion associated locus B family protein [Hyphomicrobiaceae bacterium]
MLRVISAFITALLLGSLAALPTAPAQTTRPASVFGDWTAHAHQDAKAKICYAASQPKTQEPKAAKRDPAFFYVSAWPKDGVKTEVSVKIGYPLKKDSEVTVTVGKDTFKLFTTSERAFVGDPAQEVQLVETMKKGSTMQVRGTSERGTATIDTYSLNGLPQAMQALVELCQ